MNTEQRQAYGWAKTHDYPSIAARYARALATAVDDLRGQLAESQRREQAAVEDLKMVCISGEPCTSCKECRNMGDRFPCALGGWCGGTKWQWRGQQEAGKGGQDE